MVWIQEISRAPSPALRWSTLDLRAGRIAQAAFVFDMNRLFEEFVAEFLLRHVRRTPLPGGVRLSRVHARHFVGKLFGEFELRPDLRLVFDGGREVLLDTKYKVLHAGEPRGGLSQADFYQMFAYARGDRERFDDVVLLYPRAVVDTRTYANRPDGPRVHVRTLDLRAIFDPRRGAVDERGALKEFGRALSLRD